MLICISHPSLEYSNKPQNAKYPKQPQVTPVGEENLTEYEFGKKFTGHRFRSVCGVPVFVKLYDIWFEERKEMVGAKLESLPLRVSVLDDVEWDELNVKRTDEAQGGYAVPY